MILNSESFSYKQLLCLHKSPRFSTFTSVLNLNVLNSVSAFSSFLLLAHNTGPVSRSWKKEKSVEVGIPHAQRRLVLLVGDGESHNVARFVLLPCNRLNISIVWVIWRKCGCDHRPVCKPLSFSYIIYSGCNPSGGLPVYVTVEVHKHVEPGDEGLKGQFVPKSKIHFQSSLKQEVSYRVNRVIISGRDGRYSNIRFQSDSK